MEKIKHPFSVPAYEKRLERVTEAMRPGLDRKAVPDYLVWFISTEIYPTDKKEVKQVLRDLVSFYRGERLIKAVTGMIPLWEHGIYRSRWNGTRTLRKVPIRIGDITRKLSKGYWYSADLHFLEGTAAGLSLPMTFSKSYTKYCVYSLGGLLKEEYLPEDISGLYALVDIKHRKGTARITDWVVNNSILNRNRPLLKDRKGECTGPWHEGPCMDCPAGRARCPISRHAEDYPEGDCVCDCIGKHTGYIVRAGICKYCLDKGVFIKQTEKHK